MPKFGNNSSRPAARKPRHGKTGAPAGHGHASEPKFKEREDGRGGRSPKRQAFFEAKQESPRDDRPAGRFDRDDRGRGDRPAGRFDRDERPGKGAGRGRFERDDRPAGRFDRDDRRGPRTDRDFRDERVGSDRGDRPAFNRCLLYTSPSPRD